MLTNRRRNCRRGRERTRKGTEERRERGRPRVVYMCLLSTVQETVVIVQAEGKSIKC